jgi:hypothetical protein
MNAFRSDDDLLVARLRGELQAKQECIHGLARLLRLAEERASGLSEETAELRARVVLLERRLRLVLDDSPATDGLHARA